MVTATDKAIEDALSLPAKDRLRLVEKLLASLNVPTDETLDQVWAEEAERRSTQIERGEARLVPGAEVFARLRMKRENDFLLP